MQYRLRPYVPGVQRHLPDRTPNPNPNPNQVCNAIYLTGAKRLVGVLPLPLFFTMVFWIGSLGLGLALLLLTDAELSRDINQGLFGWTQPNRTRLPLQAA